MSQDIQTPYSLIAIRQALSSLVTPPDVEMNEFLSLFESRFLGKGEFLVHAGEWPSELVFVNSGLLRFFYQTSDGKEFNKSFITENQFTAAYSAFLADTVSRFSIQALEDCRLLVCDLQIVADMFDRHRCWERLGRILAEQLFAKKEAREAEFLLDDAETRYNNFLLAYPGIERRLAQYHIASYLGITPVALSRIRKNTVKMKR